MKHTIFKIYRPCDVSYNPEDRASVTYYKGAVRFNGYPAPSRNIDIKNKDNTLHGILNRDQFASFLLIGFFIQKVKSGFLKMKVELFSIG